MVSLLQSGLSLLSLPELMQGRGFTDYAIMWAKDFPVRNVQVSHVVDGTEPLMTAIRAIMPERPTTEELRLKLPTAFGCWAPTCALTLP